MDKCERPSGAEEGRDKGGIRGGEGKVVDLPSPRPSLFASPKSLLPRQLGQNSQKSAPLRFWVDRQSATIAQVRGNHINAKFASRVKHRGSWRRISSVVVSVLQPRLQA